MINHEKTWCKTMFGFIIKKTFIGVLRVCTIVGFRGSLAPNSRGPIKSLSLTIDHVKQDQHLSI